MFEFYVYGPVPAFLVHVYQRGYVYQLVNIYTVTVYDYALTLGRGERRGDEDGPRLVRPLPSTTPGQLHCRL